MRTILTWGLGRLLSKLERLALTVMLMAGNLFGCLMLMNKIITFCVNICGCCGISSTMSWKEALCWACCSTCTLAARARKGFQSPSSLAPSAPPHPTSPPSALLSAGTGGSAPEGTSVKPFSLNRWRARKSKKKASAPPPSLLPGSTEESRSGHLLPIPGGSAPSHAAPKSAKELAPDLVHLAPQGISSRPPAPKRSSSAPRSRPRSRREEEVEVLLPANNILDGYRQMARALYRKP